MGEIEVTPQEMLAKDGMFEQLWYWDLSSCHEGCALHENFTSISRGNHLYSTYTMSWNEIENHMVIAPLDAGKIFMESTAFTTAE